MSNTPIFTEEILEKLNNELGITGDVAWFDTLKKSISSKNITIPDWNNAIWKLATTVSGQEFLREAIVQLSAIIDTSVEHDLELSNTVHDHENRIRDNSSNIQSLDNRTTSIANTVANHSSRMLNVEATSKTHTSGIASLKSRVSGLEGDVGGYSNIILETRRDLSETKDIVGDAIDTVREELERLDDASQVFERRIASNEDTLKNTPVAISLEMDPTTYKIRAKMYDRFGNVVSTSGYIDLPIESSIINIEFVEEAKALRITLRNGNVTSVPIGHLIDGIVTSLNDTSTSKVMSAATGALIKRAIADSVVDKATKKELTDAVDTLSKDIADRVSTEELGTTLAKYVSASTFNNTLKNYDTSDVVDSKDDDTYLSASSYTDSRLTNVVKKDTLDNTVSNFKQELMSALSGKVSSEALDATLKEYAPAKSLEGFVLKDTFEDEVSKIVNNNVSVESKEFIEDISGTIASWGLGYMLVDEGTAAKVRTMGRCTDTEVVVPNNISGVPVIGVALWNASNLKHSPTRVTLPSTAVEVGAFTGLKELVEVKLHEGILRITEQGFDGCLSLNNLKLPNTLESICAYAFRNCNSFTELTIPNNVSEIGLGVAKGCANLETVVIGDSAPTVPSSAFEVCSKLHSVYVGRSVHTIESSAFRDCTSLERIDLPATLESIGANAFSNCTSLAEVYYEGSYVDWLELKNNISPYGNSAILNIDPTCSDHAPATVSFGFTLNDDSTGYIVSRFRPAVPMDIEIPSVYRGLPVTAIGDTVFRRSNVLSVRIPNSVERIGNLAFADCTRLTRMYIGSGVTYIGERAFERCDELKDIYIYDLSSWCNATLAAPSASPFSQSGKIYINDKQLIDLDIPSTVTVIKPYTFTDAPIRDVSLPSTVTEIGTYAFFRSTVERAYLNNCESLREVGDFAFAGCTNLKTIETSPYFKDVDCGAAVFQGCTKLANVSWAHIPLARAMFEGCVSILDASVHGTTVPALAFKDSGLMTIYVDEGVTSIGEGAFSGCTSLHRVTLPASLVSIARDAFKECPSIQTLTYAGSSTDWNSMQIGTGNDSLTNAGLVSYDASFMFKKYHDGASYIIAGAYEPSTAEYTLTIPSTYDGLPVTRIAPNAFEDYRQLKSISIPSSIVEIGHNAFTDCSRLSTVTFDGDYLDSIGYHAFSGCTGLREIVLPNRVDRFGSHVFNGCTKLTSATLPTEVLSLGDGMFNGCSSLLDIEIPAVDTIPQEFLQYCSSLETCSVPEGVETIKTRAFSECHSLKTVTLPQTIAKIESDVFYNCVQLEDVYYDGWRSLWASKVTVGSGNSVLNNVATLHYTVPTMTYVYVTMDKGYRCDGYSKYTLDDVSDITEVSIPNTYDGRPVTSIGEAAFKDCTNLKKVFISDGITVIHDEAFANCTNLIDVHVPDTLAELGEDVFKDTVVSNTFDEQGYAFVPSNTNPHSVLLAYSKDVAKRTPVVTLPDDVHHIGSNAFRELSTIENITLPSTLKSISYSAFLGCSSITRMEIPDTVTHIGDWAFSHCSALGTVHLPENLTHLGFYAFKSSGCLSVKVPPRLKELNSHTFSGCTKLVAVVLPKSLLRIYADAFEYCTKLELVVYEGTDYEASLIDIKPSGNTSLTQLKWYTADNPYSDEPTYDRVFPDTDEFSFSVDINGTGLSVVKYIGDLSADSVVVPNTYKDVPIVTLGAQCFKDTLVSNVSINYACRTVSLEAFAECPNLASVRWSPNANTVGILERAFYNCRSLKEFTLPSKVSYIGSFALAYTSIAGTVNLTNASLYESAFAYSKVSEAYITSSKLASTVFEGSQLKKLALTGTSIDSAEGICKSCVQLEDVQLCDSCTTIPPNAFADSGIQYIYIPSTVGSIGKGAFRNCSKLKRIDFGGTVQDWSKLVLNARVSGGNDILAKDSIDIQFNV